MTVQPNEPTTAVDASVLASDPVTKQEPAAAAPEPPKPTAPQAEAKANPWDDPEAAKAEIERLRKENGAARTNAKAQAADEARAALAQEFGKILGFVKDDEPVDPAALTAQLTTERETTQQAKVALAVYQAAADAGGDPAALLDSSSFLAKVKTLDPTDSAAVAAAITEAVAANPRLGAASTTRVPAPNPAQGSSASGPATPAQLTEAEVKRMYAAKDYAGIEQARQEGRLANILGG